MFLLHVMSVPALIRHLEMLAPETVPTLAGADLFAKSLELLSNDQVRTLEPSDSRLSFMNLVFKMEFSLGLNNKNKYNTMAMRCVCWAILKMRNGPTDELVDRPSHFR